MEYNHRNSFSILILLLAVSDVFSFHATNQYQSLISRNLQLDMARVKRGKLGSNISSISKPQRKNKKTKKVGKAGKSNASIGVAPGLADWASSQDDTTIDGADLADTGIKESSSAATFSSFKDKKTKKTSSRRTKQMERQAKEEERQSLISEYIEKIEDALDPEKKSSVEEILDPIRQLVKNVPSTNLRQLTSGVTRNNYRLAWVGSDDAICHIGTGLHKVPLARLQEVFLSYTGRSRIEVLEVIRVLGPFPNVKNTLQGATKTGKNSAEQSELKITYDSMIDGTGKEILAGTDENTRAISLNVCFSDEAAIVAVVPPEDAEDDLNDPFANSGSSVLFFVREDDLDTKLEKLRVI